MAASTSLNIRQLLAATAEGGGRSHHLYPPFAPADEKGV
jgi:hypothetical protein